MINQPITIKNKKEKSAKEKKRYLKNIKIFCILHARNPNLGS